MRVEATVNTMRNVAYTLIEKPINEQEFSKTIMVALMQDAQFLQQNGQELGNNGCYDNLSYQLMRQRQF